MSTPTVHRDGLAEQIRDAGVAGAGGAGFPSYVKWQNLDDVRHMLVNHQESEPNYYSDKWLGRERAEELATILTTLREEVFDAVVVGTKEKYREEWMGPLEEATGANVYLPGDIPLDADEEEGLAVAYTGDMYDFSEEQALLMITVGERIGRDLPTDHGWLVHNTETLYNISRAVRDGTPVTRKYVHVDGDTPEHRCLEVPIGTTAADLLAAAGLDDSDIDDDQVLADGGPGWCYEIAGSAPEFGVRKRTNALLVLGRDEVEDHTEQEGRINVLDARDWHDRDHETEPHELRPDRVRIPLITNAAYEGFVAPGDPCVEVGDGVSEGDVVARPGDGRVAIPHHASIDGEVVEVTETHVVVER